MRSDDFQRVDRAFQAALAAREAGREKIPITVLCDGDQRVAGEVRSLLAHAGDVASIGGERPTDDSGEVSPNVFLDPKELHRGRGSSAFAATPESHAAGEAMLSEWGASAAGQRVGDFTLISPIGVGGMGVVFIAEQERPRRTVALKLVRRAAATPTLVRRFEREAQLLGRLNHPGIAQIYAAGVAELLADRSAGDGLPPIRVPYLAMEWVNGSTILEFVRGSADPQHTALELVAQACDAVAHAHQRGVIHRDLKPANILVAGDGSHPPSHPPQVKVLDFGVARDASINENFNAAQLATITLAGHIVGTLAYMSPEQIRGADVDVRCDVYALGVILFELLTGRQPFDTRGCSLPEVARRIADEEVPPLSSIDRSLRGDVETIVAKALAKDPARRYQSCRDFARDLRALLAGEPIEARRDSIAYVWRQRAARYRTLLAGAALLLAMTAGVAVYAKLQERRATEIAHEAVLAERRADAARQQAMDASARLAEELAASRIEQGRLLGLSGDAAGAEKLLWDAYLARPDSAAARWALREHYVRSGCAMTAEVGIGDARALAILPGEPRRFVAGSEQSPEIGVWSFHGQRLAGFETDLLAVHAIEAASDGHTMIAAGRRGVRVIDLTTRQARPLGPSTEAWTIAVFQPKQAGALIAIGSADGLVRLVTMDGEELETITAPVASGTGTPAVRTLAFNNGGTQLAVGYDNGSVRLLRLRLTEDKLSVEPGPPIAGRSAPGLMSVAFSKDDGTLATGGADRKLILWRTDTGERIASTSTENGTARGIAPSPDGRYFAVTGFYGTRLFNARTGAPATLAHAPLLGRSADGDYAVRFTDDGAQMIVAGAKGLCHVWEWSPVRTFSDPIVPTYERVSDPAAAIRDLCVARVGQRARIVMTTMNGRVTLREADALGADVEAAWKVRWQTNVSEDKSLSATCVGLTGDGGIVFVGLSNGRLALMGAENGKRLGELDAHDGSVTAARSVPGRDWIVTGGVEGTAHLWQRQGDSFTRIASMPCDGEVIGLAVRPQGDAVAITARPGSVRWFALPDGRRLGTQTDTSTPWRPTFSPDGSRFAAGAWDRGIRVWDVPTNLTALPLPANAPPALPTRSLDLAGHTQLVLQEAFDVSGERLASVSSDGTLRIWNVSRDTDGQDRRRLLATFDAAAGDAIAVASLPGTGEDAPIFITGHADGRLRLWDWNRIDRFIEGQRVRQQQLRAAVITQ